MRELQLWEDDGGLDLAFGDISSLAADCRFSDCKHEREEGCAVLEAVASGVLEEKRLVNYRKTQKELRYQNSKEVKQKRKTAAAAVKAAPRTRNSGWQQVLDEY
ncbi:putative ribosome biogenesis GTPase RsgA [compost metagenome]